MENNERRLLICGDIHGELRTLVYKLKEELKVEEADVIVVGDFGVGFGSPNSMGAQYERVKEVLASRDIILHAIRGNHDDPQYFDGYHDYLRLKFLKDHTVHEIAGKKIYTIGGATSLDIDRKDARGMSRRDYNERYIKYGSSKRCWWPDEGIVMKKEELPIKVDIILSHDSPINFDPVPIRPGDTGYETWEKVIEERKYLSWIASEILASRWYYGHHHRHYAGSYGEKLYTGLGIMELCEVY